MSLASIKQKVILGTVQLGLPYGINNVSGKPDEKESERILDKATHENIHLLDSAEAYGSSLYTIGSYLKKHSNSPFRVISKFINDGELLQNKVHKTLSLLGHDSLYGYMYHRFEDYKSGHFKKQLRELKTNGDIKYIGISLYSSQELKESIDDSHIDIIQIPFNPLDASEKKLDLFARAREAGKEIHARSVFLQGLFFKPATQLTGSLKEFSRSLRALENIALDYRLSVREICLNFALHEPNIDYVLIGVETLEQLEQNIRAINEKVPDALLTELKSIPSVSESLLNPSTWKP